MRLFLLCGFLYLVPVIGQLEYVYLGNGSDGKTSRWCMQFHAGIEPISSTLGASTVPSTTVPMNSHSVKRPERSVLSNDSVFEEDALFFVPTEFDFAMVSRLRLL